jgi:sialate O-acetylesterase
LSIEIKIFAIMKTVLNKSLLQKILAAGILLITFSACRSEDNLEVSEKDLFQTVDEMFSSEKKSYINLKGMWKFSIGDDDEWADHDFDDTNWEAIHVPSLWENEGFYGYNGFAWYRKTIEINKNDIKENLFLYLGYIDDVDETYFNGELIGTSGSLPPHISTAYNAQRKYFIPASAIKEGKNVIAVRVYDIHLDGGITKGNIGIYKSEGTKTSIASAYNLDLDIYLHGKWKFKTGDNLDWSKNDFDDSGWNEIFVPAAWESRGYSGYDGFGWYRKKFILPENFKDKKMVLMLGRIDDIDQTYVNGKLIGSIGDWNFEDQPVNFNTYNEWETLRAYFVPDNILKPGEENIISVRVFDGFVDGGIYDGPIGLITQQKYREFWMNK